MRADTWHGKVLGAAAITTLQILCTSGVPLNRQDNRVLDVDEVPALGNCGGDKAKQDFVGDLKEKSPTRLFIDTAILVTWFVVILLVVVLFLCWMRTIVAEEKENIRNAQRNIMLAAAAAAAAQQNQSSSSGHEPTSIIGTDPSSSGNSKETTSALIHM